MEEIFQISQTISRIIIFEIRILTCNIVLLLRKTFESSERSLVYKLNIEKFIPGYIYVLFSNNKKSNYHCTRRIIIFERNILTHLSSYLIFIRILFQERKAWPTRQHFEGEACIQTKCIEIANRNRIGSLFWNEMGVGGGGGGGG